MNGNLFEFRMGMFCFFGFFVVLFRKLVYYDALKMHLLGFQYELELGASTHSENKLKIK